MFNFEILENVEIDKLNERETYWIDLFNSTNRMKGFNCHNGGSASKIAPETREKISLALKGRKRSLESIEKSIKTKKENGYVHSKESREKMSIASKGRKISKEHIQKLKDRIFSEETRMRMSESHKCERPWAKGKVGIHSEEGIRRISETSSGRLTGEKSPNAIINTEKASQIVILLNNKEKTSKAISEELGVSMAAVKNIRSGASWNHVSGYPKKPYKKRNRKTS